VRRIHIKEIIVAQTRGAIDAATIAGLKRVLWIALLLAGSVLFSFALDCATPFAALAALAALNMPRRDVLTVVALAWVANQAIGFGLLGYPHTTSTYIWGWAIGIAALVGAIAAGQVADRTSGFSRITQISCAFLAAFTTYELVLLATSLILTGGANAFTPAIIWLIFSMNAIALGALLVLHRLALATGLLTIDAGSGARIAAA